MVWQGKNVHIHHKQEAYKGYKQTVEIDADVSVTIKKQAVGADYKSVFMGANK